MALKESTFPASPKKIVKKPAVQYWNVLLYNNDQAASILNGLTLAACNPTNEHRPSSSSGQISLNEDDEVKVVQREDFTSVSDKMACGCCNIEFTSRKEQIEHYKSDWHRYNIQRSLKGHNPVTESHFEDAAGDISSISGSDDSDDNEDENEDDGLTSAQKLQKKLNQKLKHVTGNKDSGSSDSDTDVSSVAEDSSRKYPKLFFKNQDGQLISLYRCVIYHKKNQPENANQLISMTTDLLQSKQWVVLMASGGHFAGAIFKGSNVIVHKTFHRYIIRAKRGTVQSGRDSHGKATKSAGSTLRRYNEAALKEDIVELIKSWQKEIETSDLIFMRAPSFNKKIFFSGKSPPLNKHDTRIRMIPFVTRRPTFNEVKRVHEMLRSVECYGSESEIQDHVPKAPTLIYRPDTGSLEVFPQQDKSIKSVKEKKAKKGTNPEDDVQSSPQNVALTTGSVLDALKKEESALSSGASTVSDSELVESMETLSTSDLKMFDMTKKRPSKKPKNRKRRPSLKHQQSPESNAFDEEKYHLKNALYTACKIGDLETLRNLLAVFNEPFIVKNDPKDSNCAADVVVDTDYNQTSERSESTIQFVRDDNLSISKQDSENNSVELETSNSCTESIPNESINEKVEHDSTSLRKTSLKLNSLGNTPQSSPKRSKNKNKDPVEDILSPVVTNAILNEPIGDRQTTLLHIAAKEAHGKLVLVLMEAGADPAIIDKFGQTPYTGCDNKETRNEFRRFMHRFPDQYNYEKAKIPGPLTPEMEAERRKKDAERKKIQRKAKQERMKEIKAEEAVKQAEEAEKQRFLSLSDREKRALAAERRIMQQKTTQGEAAPVLSRCFQCGADITGKVPFEYCDFRFCTTKCLKEHRMKQQKR